MHLHKELSLAGISVLTAALNSVPDTLTINLVFLSLRAPHYCKAEAAEAWLRTRDYMYPDNYR